MKCDGCTLCCKLIHIPWMNSPAGEYCKECNPNIGCNIFNTVNKNCLEYNCAYNQMENISVDLRPDKCHLIFEKLSENIFTGLLDIDNEINDIVKRQINSLLKQGFSVSLSVFGEKIPMIFPREGKTGAEIFNEVKKILDKRNGSSNIHNRLN